MARLPLRIDWIEHKRTGVKVALRLDKKTMLFQAEYAGETVKNHNGNEVREQIVALIAATHKLTFDPIIELKLNTEQVRYDRQRFENCDLNFAYRRYCFARADRLYMISWEAHGKEWWHETYTFHPTGFRSRKHPPEDFVLPHECLHGTTRTIYLEYSDEVWAGLERIDAAIGLARAQLNKLLEVAHAVKWLRAVGQGAVTVAEHFMLVEGDQEDGADLQT